MANNSKLQLRTPQGFSNFSQTKGGSVKVEMKWDKSWGARQTSRFQKAQMFIDSECLRYNSKYVPFRYGILIGSGVSGTEVGSGTLRYIAPYARSTYYIRKNYKGAPMRGAYHFERMKIDHRATILRGAAQIAGGK